jgi:glycerol-3-phosphate dehydrogenase
VGDEAHARNARNVARFCDGKLELLQHAKDAVDTAVGLAGLGARPCRTRDLPLVGAAPRDVLASVEGPARLVRRYGVEAPDVLAAATAVVDDPLRPVAPGSPITWAELLWAVTHEGALDVDDLLYRRTRVGLVAADRSLAEPAAREALHLADTTTPA